MGVTAKRGGMTNGEDDCDYSLLLLFFFLINNDSQFSIYLVNSQNSRYSKTNTVEDVVEKSG